MEIDTGGDAMVADEFLSILKQRNTALDAFFYDVGKLSKAEKNQLIEANVREGSIIIVPPSQSDEPLKLLKHPRDFIAGDHHKVTKFVIAGVGSSDVGAAALARNVADFFAEPVAAIVAGYGLEDLVSEALGGWFVLGQANRRARIVIDENHQFSPDEDIAEQDIPFVKGNPDSTTLLHLLLSGKVKCDLLLGHSKGCLSIANALFGLIDYGYSTIISNRINQTKVITTGAVVELPEHFDHYCQFLGSIDWFGGLNSRIGLPFHAVPGAFHHTNTQLPFSLSVEQVLAAAIDEDDIPAIEADATPKPKLDHLLEQSLNATNTSTSENELQQDDLLADAVSP